MSRTEILVQDPVASLKSPGVREAVASAPSPLERPGDICGFY